MNSGTKINSLIKSLPRGSVLLPSWLLSQGYSYELQQSYRKSGWLKSIGKGAMLKSGDPFVLTGALSALQNIENINIHNNCIENAKLFIFNWETKDNSQ